MLSDNKHYPLLEKLDDEEGKWWLSYTCAITEEDDGWEMEDAAVLAIAYLVESGYITYEEVAKATQALARCSEWDIGKTTFIERVMKDASAARAKGAD